MFANIISKLIVCKYIQKDNKKFNFIWICVNYELSLHHQMITKGLHHDNSSHYRLHLLRDD